MMKVQLKPNHCKIILSFNWKDATAQENYSLIIPQKLVTQKIVA